MWGETLFNIDEDAYGEYKEVPDSEHINVVPSSELNVKRFKDFFDSFIQRLSNAKRNMPEFQITRVRRFIDIQLSKVESNVGFYDVMEDAKIKNNEFYRMCNIFVSLSTKLHEIEEKVGLDLGFLPFYRFLILGIFGFF